MPDMRKLLEDIKLLNDEHEKLMTATGGNFNIFEITNMAHKEVQICQVIKELINPKGSHCQGDIFLRLFVEHVLKLKDAFSEELYSKTVVTAEHVIDANRRIDIYIKAGDKLAIPIEAKIWAGDQDEQVHDYYEYAKGTGAEEVILYYLTCDGHMPSASSTYGMKKNDIEAIQLITFETEIIEWLEECLNHPATLKLSSIREIMIQLMDALKRLTGQVEDEIEVGIRKMIDNRDMFRSADQLASVITDMKEELKDKIFAALDARISEEYGLARIEDKYDFEYVTQKSKNYRGITYNLGNITARKYSLGLRITIEGYLYAEFCVLEKGEIRWDDFTKIVQQEDILKKKVDTDVWSIARKYLIQDEEKRPYFYAPHNDAYYSLIEENAFQTTIDSLMKELDEFVRLLKPEYRII